MPSKYRMIVELASQTARDITSNAERYTDFLVTAANNYKYTFKEQLLIHAQKPDATACAEIEIWNKFGRWVNKGTKGIALLVDRDIPYKLRHVFDISDTNSLAGKVVTLWQMKPEYEFAVSESLQNSFGDVEEPKDFPYFLMDITGHAVEDNFSDYLSALSSVKGGSLLEELDDTNLEVWLKEMLKNSVAFMTLSRVGYDPRQYFTREDFSRVYDFNRTLGDCSCKECESEFIASLPQLLTMYYARENNLNVVLRTTDAIGLPVDAFIPYFNLVVDGFEHSRKIKAVKKSLCNQNGITYCEINSKDPFAMAAQIKALFRKNHVYITSENENDIRFCRNLFFSVKRKNARM